MFQRLKDALDSRIAEEQARQRAALHSTSHSSQSSSTPIQKPLPIDVSPSTWPRQQEKSTLLAERGPDPSEFESEATFGNDVDNSVLSGEQNIDRPAEVQHLDNSVSMAGVKGTKPTADGKEAVTLEPQGTGDLPTEVCVKLRKFDRLEGKYQELLNAYRVAHGRVQTIEPFEASLREHTPLTSINDPAAFLEYLTQINLRSDMVLDELKRVASERDDLRKKSTASEQETHALKVEVADLKQKHEVGRPEETLKPPTLTIESPGQQNSADHAIAAVDPADPVKPQSPSLASHISRLSLLSPQRRAAASPRDAVEETEEFFSYDNELPRLQTELEEQQTENIELKKQVSTLQRDLLVARESAESMAHNLENATQELQSLRDAEGASGSSEKRPEDPAKTSQQVRKVMSPIDEASRQEADDALTAPEPAKEDAKSYIDRSLNEGTALRYQLSQKEERIKELEDSLVAAVSTQRQKVEQRQSESTSQKQIGVLNNILKSLRFQLETAEGEIAELKAVKSKLDAELGNLRQQNIHKAVNEEVKTEGPANVNNGYVRPDEQPSTKYFGFVNDEEFSLTGDMPEALQRFSKVMRDTRPQLYRALVSPEKSIGDLDKHSEVSTLSNNTVSKSKKKKKRKGKGGDQSASGHQVHAPPAKVTEMLDEAETELQTLGINTSSDTLHLKSQIKTLEAQMEEKAATISRLSGKLKDQAVLDEEIEILRDDLLHQGEGHIEARDALKAARQENDALQERISNTERDLAHRHSARPNQAYEDLSSKFEDLERKHSSLQRDLAASEQVAAARFKDVTDLREVLAKAQPELRNLRSEVEELRPLKNELRSKVGELSRLGVRHEDLKADMKSLGRKIVEKDAELKDLQQRLADGRDTRAKFEGDLRAAKADLQNTEAQREAATNLQNETSREMAKVRADFRELETRNLALETEVSSHVRNIDALREDINLKSTLHESSQAIVAALREQTVELSTQARETSNRADSLEEELAEVQRLLTERSHEAETMRRLLADAEGRTSGKIREMKERMEVAVEERAQVEDEASTNNRRMAREVEDLRNKAREATRSLKLIEEETEELEFSQRVLKRTRNELETASESSRAEVAELQAAMQHMRAALDQREKDGTDLEQQRIDNKRTIEGMRETIERLQNSNKGLADELKASQKQRKENIRPPTGLESGRRSLRSSFDPNSNAHKDNLVTVSPSTTLDKSSPNPSSTPTSRNASSTVDGVYLKNVLLQFLEQKDRTLQKQLIPVLGMLLNFDRQDEQKWMAAITTK